MSKFLSFMDNYADPFRTIHKIGDYVSDNDGVLISTTELGGFGKLGSEMHKEIQRAVSKTLIQWQSCNDPDGRKVIEDEFRKGLLRSMRQDIEKYAEVKKDSKISISQMAQYFVDEIFEPLLDQAKDIEKDLAVAKVRGKPRQH